jgi:hypothetical protein
MLFLVFLMIVVSTLERGVVVITALDTPLTVSVVLSVSGVQTVKTLVMILIVHTVVLIGNRRFALDYLLGVVPPCTHRINYDRCGTIECPYTYGCCFFCDTVVRECDRRCFVIRDFEVILRRVLGE